MLPLTPKMRFLILTSDSGYGHRSVANAIVKALQRSHPMEGYTTVINPITDQLSHVLLKTTESNYDHNVCHNQGFYRFSYDISDSHAASFLLENTYTLMLYKRMRQIINQYQPHAILNTFSMYNAPMGAVLSLQKRKIPFYTIITDLADVHTLWFNPKPDRYFVASQAVKTQAIASGLSAEKIIVSGIPVDPDFDNPAHDKTKFLRALGLNPDLTTILIVGSRRVNGIIENLQVLNQLQSPFQVIVIAGGDETLYQELIQHIWKFPIHIENFVSNMPEYMASADILITKAGGLILSEALAARLPVILIDNLPGQESGNVRYILDNKVGVQVESPYELLKLLNAWLCYNQGALQEIHLHLQCTGHPQAAMEVADALWQASINEIIQIH